MGLLGARATKGPLAVELDDGIMLADQLRRDRSYGWVQSTTADSDIDTDGGWGQQRD